MDLMESAHELIVDGQLDLEWMQHKNFITYSLLKGEKLFDQEMEQLIYKDWLQMWEQGNIVDQGEQLYRLFPMLISFIQK